MIAQEDSDAQRVVSAPGFLGIGQIGRNWLSLAAGTTSRTTPF